MTDQLLSNFRVSDRRSCLQTEWVGWGNGWGWGVGTLYTWPALVKENKSNF